MQSVARFNDFFLMFLLLKKIEFAFSLVLIVLRSFPPRFAPLADKRESRLHHHVPVDMVQCNGLPDRCTGQTSFLNLLGYPKNYRAVLAQHEKFLASLGPALKLPPLRHAQLENKVYLDQ